jgi:zinc transporter 1
MGVFIHIMGDCANNLGVIIAGLVIWLADYHGRYYADPAVSMAIAVMIFCSSLPLSRLLSTLKSYIRIANGLK